MTEKINKTPNNSVIFGDFGVPQCLIMQDIYCIIFSEDPMQTTEKRVCEVFKNGIKIFGLAK